MRVTRNSREWRDHLPHDCPPSDAEPAKGEFYRLIKKKHTHPQLEDFRSKCEENIECAESPFQGLPGGITKCQFCGLSVLKSIEDVQFLQKKIPRFRKDVAAIGTLNPNLGKIKHTPEKAQPSHYTWWIKRDCHPLKFFKIVDTNG